MLKLRTMLLASSITVAVAAKGQNTPATSTPQTRAAAPASTRPTATRAQAAGAAAAANSATYGSRRTTGSRAATARGSSASAATQGGPVQPANGSQGADYDSSAIARAVQSSGLPGIPLPHNAYGIPKGTPIHVRLQQPVDSAHATNGQIVGGVLATAFGSVPAGAPVQLTVVSVAPAGQMTSKGELSLQVVSINGEQVISDVITAEGREGTKVMPDGESSRGTEAVFTPDQPLTLPAG